jgi:hypothetical protein
LLTVRGLYRACRYNYDQFHLELITTYNNDFFLASPGPLHTCALHLGDLAWSHDAIDTSLSGIRRVFLEEDQAAEAFGICNSMSGELMIFIHILGKGAEAVQCMEDLGFT